LKQCEIESGGERGTLTAYANTLIINQLCQSVTRQRHELQNDFWQGTLMLKTLLQRFEFRKNPEPKQQFYKLFTCLKIINSPPQMSKIRPFWIRNLGPTNGIIRQIEPFRRTEIDPLNRVKS
jgi:hypothetical protein